MVQTRFSKARAIPSISTRKSSPTTTNFAKGIYTYKPNDTMNYDEIYLAQNARFDRIGEYMTRRGLNKLSEPLGKSTIFDNYSDQYTMSSVVGVSQDISSSSPIYSINLTVAATDGASYGVMQAVLSDTNDEVVAISCVKSVPTTPTDVEFIFKDAPLGSFNLTLSTQGIGSQKFQVAKIGNNIMFKLNTAERGRVTNVFETNINGETNVLFTFKRDNGGTTLNRMDDNGAVYEIRVLPDEVEKVRFLQNINKIRYADGVEGPRIIDPLNNWSDAPISTVDLKSGVDLGINVSNILDGTQDNIMYFDANTTTQAVWTYPYGFSYENQTINSYDKFDRDFRQNFPAIETGDPLTAMFNLGGVVYMLTRRNKYYMYSQTADVWSQQASSAQHGTYSQESTVCDLNYAYYANDDGIYMFDGSSESSLTEKTIQKTYDAIKGKESIVLELYNNRLYVFYSSTGNGVNDSSLVYNVNLRLWESFDTGTCVSATSGRKSPTNRFICGSSAFGQLYIYEASDNEYADLGAPIAFDLETAYLHFGTPSQLHRITKWRPEFNLVDGEYTIKCGYALDFTDNVKYAYSINLQNQTILQETYVWDNPASYGNNVTPTKLTTIPQVNGQFRRCQIRYQHHAAFEPVNFKSHTLQTETQRLR